MFNVEELRNIFNDDFLRIINLGGIDRIKVIDLSVNTFMAKNKIKFYSEYVRYIWMKEGNIYYIIMSFAASGKKYIIYTKLYDIIFDKIDKIFIEEINEVPGDILTVNSIIVCPNEYIYKNNVFTIKNSLYQDILEMYTWHLLKKVGYDKTVLPPEFNMTTINDFYEKEIKCFTHDMILGKPIKDKPRVYIYDGKKAINIDHVYEEFKKLKEREE